MAISLLNPNYLLAKKKLEEEKNQTPEQKAAAAERRKKSRWGTDLNDKTFVPGMPTIMPTGLSADQEEAYLLQLQIEECSQKLRTGDLGISVNPEERSPSPEPIYNHEGKRLNTRDYRTRKNLEDKRHDLITRLQEINPDYKPPSDYKPQFRRMNDKVMIPQDSNPEINFIGLLIGPRGNTLRQLEKDTGAKIIIRGKGSIKEGKVGRKDGQPLPGEDEPLHAYITANVPEAVKKAADKIKEIIKQAIEIPDDQNDLRRGQLRELALLNGTMRDNDGPRCSNCGGSDHRSWQCPDKPNVTNTVVCTICGGAGHISKDCKQIRPGTSMPEFNPEDPTKIDEEYMSLMAELGEGPGPQSGAHGGRPSGGYGSNRSSMFDQQRGPIRALMAPPSGGSRDSFNANQNNSMDTWRKNQSVPPLMSSGGQASGSRSSSGPYNPPSQQSSNWGSSNSSNSNNQQGQYPMVPPVRQPQPWAPPASSQQGGGMQGNNMNQSNMGPSGNYQSRPNTNIGNFGNMGPSGNMGSMNNNMRSSGPMGQNNSMRPMGPGTNMGSGSNMGSGGNMGGGSNMGAGGNMGRSNMSGMGPGGYPSNNMQSSSMMGGYRPSGNTSYGGSNMGSNNSMYGGNMGQNSMGYGANRNMSSGSNGGYGGGYSGNATQQPSGNMGPPRNNMGMGGNAAPNNNQMWNSNPNQRWGQQTNTGGFNPIPPPPPPPSRP